MRVLEEGTEEKREHPLDREYRRLECSIQLMAESDPMFQVLVYSREKRVLHRWNIKMINDIDLINLFSYNFGGKSLENQK